MTLLDVGIGLLIALGIVGIVVPLLPGTLLVAGAVLVWAWVTGGTAAWVVFAVVAGLLLVGAVVKYAVPGRRLNQSGVPASTLAAGGVLGVVGFFVIPVVGLVVGFVGGVYLAERHRLGAEAAGRSTIGALKAVGLSIVIELAAAILAAFTWVVGVVVA